MDFKELLVAEKNYEKKSPDPTELKPVEPRQIPDKTAKAVGSAALKGSGKK
jgi:hypothetical protein